MVLDYVGSEEQDIDEDQEEQGITLEELMQAENIVDILDEEEVSRIGTKAIDEYNIDVSSRADWEIANKKSMELAMLVAKEKSSPWPNAANVKHPLLAQAAFEFNARAYPAIVQGNRIAKCNTWGEDPQGTKAARSERVSEHLSFQLLSKMPEWEEDTDRLLVVLPIAGCMFRKVWYDPGLGRNVTRLVSADNLVVNYYARSMADTPRSTERMYLYPYEIQERILSGRFIDFDYADAPKGSDSEGKQAANEDDHAPHLFLEQHRLLDLDGDGYPEPYIVTIHEGSNKVCRIVANYDEDSVRISPELQRIISIRKRDFYVKYDFLPSPDGAFYGVGFGYFLRDILASINTTINQMLDAGSLSNMQGGLVSNVTGLRERKIKLGLGEWKVMPFSGDLSKAVMPINYPGPSTVLFQLLGFLVQTGEGISAIKDVLTGEGQGKNASPTTTLALIEQGLSVFTAIFKRVHRALKAELGIHARLNRENLSAEEYNALFDGQEQYDPAQDYSEDDMDILPVSDPNVASRMQELAKAQFLLDTGMGDPNVDQVELKRRVWAAGNVEDVDKLFVQPPQPDPEEEMLKRILTELTLEEQETNIALNKSKAIKNIADAEAAEEGPQMNLYRMVLDAFKEEINAENGQGRLSAVEGQPGNAMGAGPTQVPGGPMGNGAIPATDETGGLV